MAIADYNVSDKIQSPKLLNQHSVLLRHRMAIGEATLANSALSPKP